MEVLGDLVNHLIKSGVHGLAPLGSTGEVAYLNHEQKETIIKIVVAASNGRVPVISGVGSVSTAEAVKEAVKAEKLGVDGILAIMPTYFLPSENAIIEYFTSIANAVSCPVVLYNNPKISRADLNPKLVMQLAEINNIEYFKDASGNMGRVINIVNSNKIKLFSSSANIPATVFMLGGVGWMAGPACLIPKLCIKLFDICIQKKYSEAMELQKKIWKLNEAFQNDTPAACIKAGLILQGFEVGSPIHPQNSLSFADMEKLEKILTSLN
jgi:4-hydroxy-tetrahydrodipicolinate synthase